MQLASMSGGLSNCRIRRRPGRAARLSGAGKQPLRRSTLSNLRAAVTCSRIRVIAASSARRHTIIPRGADQVQAGDKIYLVMRKNDMPRWSRCFLMPASPPSRSSSSAAAIIGYWWRGAWRSRRSMSGWWKRSASAANFSTEHLENTVVLNFDGLEPTNLLEEGIDLADLVIRLPERYHQYSLQPAGQAPWRQTLHHQNHPARFRAHAGQTRHRCGPEPPSGGGQHDSALCPGRRLDCLGGHAPWQRCRGHGSQRACPYL